MTNERTYQIIIGVLIFIIVLGGWWMLRKGGVGAPLSSATSTVAETAQQPASAGNEPTVSIMPSNQMQAGMMQQSSSGASAQASANDAVTVVDQKAGLSVAVASVSLQQAGWVAVRNASGRTLGAAWFPEGTHMAVEVPLLRATVAGERYQILLYADNGDKQFDLHVDTLLMSGSAVAGTTFTAN